MPRKKSASLLLKFTKIIFWMAVVALVLAILLSIYVLCRGLFSTVPMGRVTRLPARQVNPPLRTIISPIPSPSPISPIPPARLATRSVAGRPTAHMISFVHDGDTIYAKNVREGIRLIGIDAPEMAGSYRCGKDAKCTETAEECGASEAKEKLKELVLNREVVLTEDTMVGVTDKYGRLLRYIYYCRGGPPWPPQEGQTQGFVPTGKCQDLSLVLIQSGLAREAGFGNSYTHQKQYRQAETEAKEKKLGIWGKCP